MLEMRGIRRKRNESKGNHGSRNMEESNEGRMITVGERGGADTCVASS